MSEIRILNVCLKKTILVDIYRQSLLSVYLLSWFSNGNMSPELFFHFFFLLKDENLVTQILATMAEPRSFFSNKRQSLTFEKNFPEFYAFAEEKVTEFLHIGPLTRR